MESALDRWLPEWDARSRHAVEIAAPPHRVYDALLTADFGRNAVVRALMAVRAIPAFVLAPRTAWRAYRARTGAPGARTGLLQGAFVVLESRPPEALVLGLTGRFWTPAGGLVPTDPARFREPVPGHARAAWSFELEPFGPGTRLSTETRVRCGDARSRRSFLRYWRAISIGSGVIRYAVLRQIKTAAERGA